jgi:hypothetical protein
VGGWLLAVSLKRPWQCGGARPRWPPTCVRMLAIRSCMCCAMKGSPRMEPRCAARMRSKSRMAPSRYASTSDTMAPTCRRGGGPRRTAWAGWGGAGGHAGQSACQAPR